METEFSNQISVHFFIKNEVNLTWFSVISNKEISQTSEGHVLEHLLTSFVIENMNL